MSNAQLLGRRNGNDCCLKTRITWQHVGDRQVTVPVYKPFALVPKVSYELHALDCCPQTNVGAADIGPVKECIIRRILARLKRSKSDGCNLQLSEPIGNACYNREILKNLRRIRRDVGVLAQAHAAKKRAAHAKPARRVQHK
jgi:hypothetical protein